MGFKTKITELHWVFLKLEKKIQQFSSDWPLLEYIPWVRAHKYFCLERTFQKEKAYRLPLLNYMVFFHQSKHTEVIYWCWRNKHLAIKLSSTPLFQTYQQTPTWICKESEWVHPELASGTILSYYVQISATFILLRNFY